MREADVGIPGFDPDEARIVRDAGYGYRRLEPMPEDESLQRFYKSGYRDALKDGGRGPELQRLLDGGPDGDREREWMAATLYADVAEVLDANLPAGRPRRLLDIGCGTGDFLDHMTKEGWQAEGLEPGSAFADAARSRGLAIHQQTFEAFLSDWRERHEQPFDAVSLHNVLEHVPQPVPMLESIAEVLVPGGCLVVRVPNDFNALQSAASQKLGHSPWWIRVPDHVNYFDHTSMRALLERLGYWIVHHTADFPMELFLLMNQDYVADPALGSTCHERRRALELSLDPPTRRALMGAFAAAGLGRNLVLVARGPGG